MLLSKKDCTDETLKLQVDRAHVANADAIKKFLNEGLPALTLEFVEKRVTRKRSGENHLYIQLFGVNLCSALETPHVPRRVQRVETRGLEKKCKGDCIELKAAKQEIAELVEENRLLRAKLDRANEDLRSSQEAQMSQNLRHCYESIINLHNQISKHRFATIKSQLSIQSHSTPLLKVQKMAM